MIKQYIATKIDVNHKNDAKWKGIGQHSVCNIYRILLNPLNHTDILIQ